MGGFLRWVLEWMDGGSMYVTQIALFRGLVL
jgi:hypothetical protein